MPLRDFEVPGLVPDADGDRLSTRQARRHCYQHSRRQQRRAEKSSHKEQSRVDQDRCLGMIVEEVDMKHQELGVIL